MDSIYYIWILLLLAVRDGASILRMLPPENEVHLKVGENFTRVCEGDRPVEWSDNVEVKIKPISAITPEGLYTETIHVPNVDELHAGTYECRYKDDNGTSPTVKVWVQGPKLLPTNESSIMYITAAKGSSVLIPCRPASEDVTVELRSDLSDARTTYDIDKGFTIDPVTIGDTGLMYTCIARRGNLVTQLPIYMVVWEELKQHPKINASLAKAIKVGDTFSLACYIDLPKDNNYQYELKWTEKQDVVNDDSRATQRYNPVENGLRRTNILTVKNASKDDAGEYLCNLTSFTSNKNQTYTLQIYDDSDEYLHVSTVERNITEKANNRARWTIYMHGVPKVTGYRWVDESQRDVTTRSRGRYQINRTSNNLEEVVLTIDNVSLQDDGLYEFQVTNGKENKTLTLNLTVKGDPLVKIFATGETVYGDFYHFNETTTLVCQALGYPLPKIKWEMEVCPQGFCGRHMDANCTAIELEAHGEEEFSSKPAGRGRKSFLNYRLTDNGYIHCSASNSISNQNEERLVSIVDFSSPSKTGFDLLGDTTPIERTDVRLTCAARKLNFEKNIQWFVKKQEEWKPLVENNNDRGYTISFKETQWSYQSTLLLINVDESFSANYSCTVRNCTDGEERRTIDMRVQRIVAPKFTNVTNLNDSEKSFGQGDTIPDLECQATGIPQPKLTWYWNDEPEDDWSEADRTNLKTSTVGSKRMLKISSKSEYSGRYTCKAENGLMAQVSMQINISGNFWWVIIVTFLSLFVVALLVCLVLKIYNDRRDREELMKKLHQFLKGDPSKLNPDLPVNDQVNLLPYHNSWEFPREKLHLGVLLGGGAFGVVFKAKAEGILAEEEVTDVAVKMVKATSNQSHLDALVRELKILGNLGKHVNIVNLLGACTKSYARRKELYVIVEFCKYGNLLNYMHRHRNDFKNQLNSATGKIDPAYYPSRSSQSPTQNEGQRVAADGYRLLEEIPTIAAGGVGSGLVVSYNPGNSYITGSNIRSSNTEMSYVTTSTNDTDGRRSSTDANWNNYRGDYQPLCVEPITTTDLVCWSFQIARGMDYLTGRNVVHGDLAARNILLADDKVVKICDFGLAHEMYRDVYEKKGTNEVLPIKWMAIESIADLKFSTKSDVWSYGVVLWELFTLGNAPYPGMKADVGFYQSLKDGFRMDKPARAPSDIYDLMNQCWSHEPSDRPNFTGIADRLGDMLDESVREHYIDLNENYSMINLKNMEGREDYLQRMRISEIASRVDETPERTYVNVANAREVESDYLQPLPPQNPAEYAVLEGNLGGGITSSSSQAPTIVAATNWGYQMLPSPITQQEEQPLPAAQDSLGPDEIFSPRPCLEREDGFDFGSMELEPSSKSQESDPSSSPAMEVNGVSNLSYVPNSVFQSEISDRLHSSGGIIEKASQESGGGRKGVLRKKNDSGVSSSSSGPASETDSPPAVHKPIVLIDNQNYFNQQSIVSNGHV